MTCGDPGLYDQGLDSLSAAAGVRGPEAGARRSEPDRLGRAGMALARSLYWLLERERHLMEDSAAMHRLAVQVARQLGDPSSESYALDHLAIALSHLGRLDEAHDLYEQALALTRRLADERGEIRVLGNLARVQVLSNRWAEALLTAQRQLHLARRARWRAAETHAHCMLGVTYQELSQLDDAAEHLATAMTQAHAAGDAYQESRIVDYLAQVYVAKGRREEARVLLRQALSQTQQGDDRCQEAFMLVTLARTYHLAGDTPAARAVMSEAATLVKEVPEPHHEEFSSYYATSYADICRPE
ncbi:tetratricopeptide repeat protein [Streptosporangium sp. NBC_01469]|uniref:tetratricopeptide repeat protein n=1 Tax=Streptosporangium sp. NBC_01469 TaxID=2903898 RepID=UPI002E2A6E4D|nr:tetratricopeptide repeat protein [Streptosporangium sp. NBC_01469]